MSSREDGKRWMTFCQHMREAIIDEQKAVPDYELLIRQSSIITSEGVRSYLENIVNGIIKDEKTHKEELHFLFDRVCPKMAFHRKGIKELRLFGSKDESFDPSEYGAVITSEGTYKPRRRKRRR